MIENGTCEARIREPVVDADELPTDGVEELLEARARLREWVAHALNVTVDELEAGGTFDGTIDAESLAHLASTSTTLLPGPGEEC